MNEAPAPVAGLLLAAGRGARLGQAKAGVDLGGELLVDRLADVLRAAACAPVIVVLGAAAADVTARARLDDAVVVANPDWSTGLSSSLRCGLAHAAATAAGAVVITLVDQPFVTTTAVERLAVAWRQGAVAATATFAGHWHPPVLLARSVWEDVARTATGDAGARDWLQAHADEVVGVPCDDVAAAADIDTPADLQRARQALQAGPFGGET